MKLYSYYRSSCSWRCRLVLEWKSAKYECIPVDLLEGQQRSPDYLELNPSGLVPSLVLDDGRALGQSVAIIEFLEETLESPADRKLLPSDPFRRAIVRQAVQIIASDTQPLQNLRIVRQLGDEQGKLWARDVIKRGLAAFQKAIVGRHGGRYSVGDQVTMADVVLVPQLYNARRFGVDLSDLQRLVDIEARLASLSEFQRAAPEAQPDYRP